MEGVEIPRQVHIRIWKELKLYVKIESERLLRKVDEGKLTLLEVAACLRRLWEE